MKNRRKKVSIDDPLADRSTEPVLKGAEVTHLRPPEKPSDESKKKDDHTEIPKRKKRATGLPPVRTSICLPVENSRWLKSIGESARSEGRKSLSQDFIARGIIRAVNKVLPDLDATNLSLADEDEFVSRVESALQASRKS